MSKAVRNFFVISELIELPLESREMIKDAFGGGMTEERKLFEAKL